MATRNGMRPCMKAPLHGTLCQLRENGMAEETAAGYLAERIDALREHIGALAAAAPRLPEEFARVREQLAQEMAERGHGVLLGLNVLLVALGFAVEGIYRYATPDRSHAMRVARSEEHTSELQSLRHLVC